ncbi:methyl-accepting chemotaxis protein [Roseomonas marmotae]|uniref:HAMP domain-containing protein n=1 Tax=Roseomonas marmotae TaxID=2768161 RepID=A0ABS3KE16_9PROT|nr:methyl-accepting chemotaxis protein [Roseomonas marmotae]MBO1075675.1 HAMP domain-containing protein [Roseomonas marmotae]QTI79533.1 HAMP domain-containing protein [Roseomonas marmotae]
MRIRTFFLACFCGVAVPGAIASAWLSGTSWSAWQRAEGAILATRATAAAQRAQTAIGVEVGSYASLLRLEAPDLMPLRSQSPETDRLLAEAERRLSAIGLPAARVREVKDRVATLRAQVMDALAQPLARRDAGLPNITQTLRNQGADSLARLGEDAARQVADLAPAASQAVEIATAVMDLRDHAGRRNTVVSAWLGGMPVTQEQLELAHQQTGRIEQAWSTASRLAAAMPDRPALQAALRHQRETYLAQAEKRWREMMALARGGLNGGNVTWPVAVVPFRAWSTPAQAEILLLRDAALDQAQEMVEVAGSEAKVMLAEALLLVLLICGPAAASAILLLRRVVQPLRALTGSVTRIAGGELELAVPGRDRRDELGEMAQAVETLRAGSLERREMAAAQQESQRLQIERARRVDTLLREFEAETASALRAVASAASEMDATAGGMAEIATSGNARAASVAGASQQASGNVQTVAAAAEELSASIAEVARQVRDSAARAQQASEAAQNTDRTVRGLSEAAGRIGDVVQLITGIASQTNLLALNATIEAARAGESGKGFAVVAGEVKSLASQTARATEEIGQQIAAMQAETERTVQAMGDIARMIRELNDATGLVAEAAGQQAEATREIGHAVAQAAAGTEEASRHATGVSEDAERTGRAAGDVRGAAGELARQAEGLRGKMDGFLAALRAA